MEKDGLIQACKVPDDPYYRSQYYLSAQSADWAWNATTGAKVGRRAGGRRLQGGQAGTGGPWRERRTCVGGHALHWMQDCAGAAEHSKVGQLA